MYVRLLSINGRKESPNTKMYVDQTNSGVVFNQNSATNFTTYSSVRAYMAQKYPNTLLGSGFFLSSQPYVIEDRTPVQKPLGMRLDE